MLYRDLNLLNITSQLINNFEYDDYLDIPILFNISKHVFDDFNNRNINQKTINEIISFCDYLMIDNVMNFILNNCKMRVYKYKLNEHNRLYYKLPAFLLNPDCKNAAKAGNLKWLEFFHKSGCKLTQMTIKNAIDKGHVNCLQYAHENGCHLTTGMLTKICKKGHLNCMKYVYENRYKLSNFDIKQLLIGGYLDCLNILMKINIYGQSMQYAY